MPTKYKYREGQKVGDHGVIFLNEIDPYITSQGAKARKAIFLCPRCKSAFTTMIRNVRDGVTVSCGCLRSDMLKARSFRHGMTNHPLYSTWRSMKNRCLNPKTPDYKYYGQRGITIFPPWQIDFALFKLYVGRLDHYGESGRTLDRINNDGHYEPGNLRWATQHVQKSNVRKQITNTSGFVGVQKRGNRFTALITVNGVINNLGGHPSKEQAAIARDIFIFHHKLFEYPLQYLHH